MKCIVKSLLLASIVIFFCNGAFADGLFGKKDGEDGRFSLEKLMDATEELIGDFHEGGSIVGGWQSKSENAALFKNVKFSMIGDYHFNGVYYSDRDLNGYNGNAMIWDTAANKEVRIQTNEIEACMYHDLTLKPRLEFYNGLITLHTEFYHGGFMMEGDVANTVIFEEKEPGYYKTIYDHQKLFVKRVFLEMITPLGFFLVGQLPEEAMGVEGVIWAGPTPLPDLMLILIYGKKSEGKAELKDSRLFYEFREGIEYFDTMNSEDYQDKDDMTALGFGLIYGSSGKSPWSAMLSAGSLVGGSGGEFTDGMNGYHVSCSGEYKKDKLYLHLDLGVNWGDGSQLSTNRFGERYIEGTQMIEMAINMVDDGSLYRLPTWETGIDMYQDPSYSLFAFGAYDMGKLKPEAGFLYLQGSKDYLQVNSFMGRSFEPAANKTPRPYIKAYLLNAIEDKYYPLVSTMASSILGGGAAETVSYQNMIAMKAGTYYQISKRFGIYGQALAAWRENVDYYESTYWDIFTLMHGFKHLENSTNIYGLHQLESEVFLQLKSVEYHQEVDPFIGLELNSKLTWFVRDGLEISLVGAYFNAGGFYEDILTPKKYKKQTAAQDNAGHTVFGDQVETFYGPYQGANIFTRTNAWKIQTKFDFGVQ